MQQRQEGAHLTFQPPFSPGTPLVLPSGLLVCEFLSRKPIENRGAGLREGLNGGSVLMGQFRGPRTAVQVQLRTLGASFCVSAIPGFGPPSACAAEYSGPCRVTFSQGCLGPLKMQAGCVQTFSPAFWAPQAPSLGGGIEIYLTEGVHFY